MRTRVTIAMRGRVTQYAEAGVEPKWFINTSIHVYIACFGYMHARHLIGTHDRHLAFNMTHSNHVLAYVWRRFIILYMFLPAL